VCRAWDTWQIGYLPCAMDRGTRQRTYLPSAYPCTQQTIFIFFTFWHRTFFIVILTLYATVCAICAHCSKCLLYFVNLFHFIEFLVIIEIWTTSHTNNGKQWMKKWYSRYWSMRWDLIEKKPEISNFLSTKHDDELLVQLFWKCIKSKYGPKIMKLVEM